MSPEAKLNSERNPDQSDRRLQLAAELLARIAVRMATSKCSTEQLPDSNTDEEEAA